MKNTNTIPQPDQPSNTVGEWTKGKLIVDERNGKLFIEAIGEDSGETYAVEICRLKGNEPIDKADAARIVECWNGYDHVKEQNSILKNEVLIYKNRNGKIEAENEALKEVNNRLKDSLAKTQKENIELLHALENLYKDVELNHGVRPVNMKTQCKRQNQYCKNSINK